MKRLSARFVLHVVLLFAATVTLVPLLWMLSASFMVSGEARSVPTPLVPDSPTLEQYRQLFSRLSVARYFLNSLLVATLITIFAVMLNGMAGYAFAKLHFRGRDRLFRLLLAALVIPSQVAMLPLFLLLKQMGVINSYFAVILPAMASIYGIFLVRQFALSIPDDMLDAARVDGAGELRVFVMLALPLMRPVLAALAIFTFLTAWNDFLWPLIVMTDSRMYTLPVALAILSGEHVQDTELMMAGAVITVIPVLGLFLVLQKQMIRGIMMGSVKG